MIDAGSDPRGGVPAAVYLDQLQGVMSNMGVSRLDKLQIIHVHKDHISSIPDVVEQYGLTPDKLFISAQFVQLREMQSVINELRTRPSTRALGYTPAWKPGTVLKDRSGGRGDVFRYSYKAGELTVENVGLRSAFRNVQANPDRASYLTRLTRQADQARVVILGDLRGTDLTLIRTAMEAQRAGSWAEFFQGVTTLSGFSHHVGAMESHHIAGMMSVLEETLLRTGRLRIVEQTHPGAHAQTRAETMELLSRLGIELVTAEMPVAGAGASSARTSRDQLATSGPQVRVRPTIPSALTEGLARLQRLVEARETIETWRPFFEEVNPSSKKTLDTELLPQIEQSLQQLRTTLRNAMEAAFRVRTSGQVVSGGTARDYGASGGPRGAAYVTALGAIPRTTPAESTLGPEGFEALARYRDVSAKEVPLQVALHAALTRGEYSDKAFAHMLSALDPTTRRSLLTGRRGGPSPRLKAFERVRAQYAFQSSVLRTDELSIPRHWSPGARAATRGGAGVLAILEILNSVVLPTIEGIQTQRRVFEGRNLLPFVRRLLLWQQIGITPKVVGVDDGFFSVEEERDPKKVIEGLNAGRWKALYFEEPGISDADVLVFGVWISHYIRNLDEFFTFFMDSFQDAISWENGSEAWVQATWKIKVGRYNLSLENHVDESWYTHDKLTKFMQVYTARLIANTEELLEEHGRLGRISDETFDRIGALNELNLSPRPLYRAHLKSGLTRVPEQPTPLSISTTGYELSLEKQEVRWRYPPRFYVYRQEGEHLEVGGADFNTYAVLRGLPSKHRTLNIGMIGGEGRTYVTEQKTLNSSGRVLIHQSLIEAEGGNQG